MSGLAKENYMHFVSIDLTGNVIDERNTQLQKFRFF